MRRKSVRSGAQDLGLTHFFAAPDFTWIVEDTSGIILVRL